MKHAEIHYALQVCLIKVMCNCLIEGVTIADTKKCTLDSKDKPSFKQSTISMELKLGRGKKFIT